MGGITYEICTRIDRTLSNQTPTMSPVGELQYITLQEPVCSRSHTKRTHIHVIEAGVATSLNKIFSVIWILCHCRNCFSGTFYE